jgi:hypothetical protein
MSHELGQDHRTFANYDAEVRTLREARVLDKDIGPKVHSSLTRIADRLLTMWVDKVNGYGVKRYEPGNSFEFNVWMGFSDVYRKFIRLERLTENAAADGKISSELTDAYADMALYCMSALSTFEQYEGDDDPFDDFEEDDA